TTITDQPALQFQLGQTYPLRLTGVITLEFAPNAANLPSNYGITNNTAVRFAMNSPDGINTTVDIPPNSTTPIPLPAVQNGSVAGDITARLTSLFNAATGQPIPLPSQPVTGRITVPRLAPIITPGSVRIEN